MSSPPAPTDIPSIPAALKRVADEKPEAPAIIFESGGTSESVNWGELHRRSNRMARALTEQGVKFGDLVTIALPNSIAFIEAAYAVWKLGATPQPVSARLPQAELDAIVALAKTPLVIGGETISAHRPVFSAEALVAASTDDSDLPDIVSPSWKAPTSGGSTGRPKLIVSGAPGLIDVGTHALFRMNPDDIALMPGPLYHNGPFATAAAMLQLGATVVLMPKFDAEASLANIARHRVSWAYFVPTMMGRIWRLPHEVRAKYDISTLNTVWHLAAPCPVWLKEEWINWLGPDVVWELYGGTEATGATTISGTEWLTHKGSVGRPVEGCLMKAFDEAGNALPPGETGEVYMKRAPGFPPTYRYIGAEARTLPDGWESIGDIGRFDEEGYLYLADRRNDMILVGGANIYPAEVEAALEEHPLVQSSAVIGLPDEDLGNRVHAIVQPRSGLTIDDLERHLSERLVLYKRPRSIEFVNENLRDDAGKVRRSALRDERIANTKS